MLSTHFLSCEMLDSEHFGVRRPTIARPWLGGCFKARRFDGIWYVCRFPFDMVDLSFQAGDCKTIHNFTDPIRTTTFGIIDSPFHAEDCKTAHDFTAPRWVTTAFVDAQPVLSSNLQFGWVCLSLLGIRDFEKVRSVY